MLVRLRGRKNGAHQEATPAGEEPQGTLHQKLSHRGFLKMVGAAAGAAALAATGKLATTPDTAEAFTYNEDLTVNGKLMVSGDTAIGQNTTPTARLDVVGGQVALDNGNFVVSKGIRFRNSGGTGAPGGGGLYQDGSDHVCLRAGGNTDPAAPTGNIIDFRDRDTNLLAVLDGDQRTLSLYLGTKIKPRSADSTAALRIAKADGTAFVTFDSTNMRVGIATEAPQSALDVVGAISISGAVAIGSDGVASVARETYYAP